MFIAGCAWTIVLPGLTFAYSVQGFPTSTILNCQTSMSYEYTIYRNAEGTSSIHEGYTGTLELLKIPVRENIGLESLSCPVCLSFLDLIYTPGDEFATVNIMKPLDAEAMIECNGFFSYSIVCLNSGVRNPRTLTVIDKNDNASVFEEHMSSRQVSEALLVDCVVVADGLFFEHEIYNAAISENKVGLLENISPAPIKAHGGNSTIVYSISTVQEHFLIDSRTGIITVQKELDHEKTSTVNLGIQASLENNSQQTADAMVIIKVEDVCEPPVFNQEVYTEVIWGVVPLGHLVVEVKAIDPDVGQTEKLQYSLMEPSSLFAVKPSSGQVTVMSTLNNGTEILRVRATDPDELYDTATVEVTVVIVMTHFVQISINKSFDIVMSRVLETASALQRGLGLMVTIMEVASGSGGNTTTVSFIAMDTNGNMVTPEDIKTNLRNNKDKVQAELQKVFGPDTSFEIIEEDKSDWGNTTKIIVSTAVISAFIFICIVLVLGVVRYWRNRKTLPGQDLGEQRTVARGPSEEEQTGTEMTTRKSDGSLGRGIKF